MHNLSWTPYSSLEKDNSILGPVLFIIYINDFSQASKVFNFISYADDTVLFSTLSNLANPKAQIQTC